jgi:hypothetical protein
VDDFLPKNFSAPEIRPKQHATALWQRGSILGPQTEPDAITDEAQQAFADGGCHDERSHFLPSGRKNCRVAL